MSDPPLLVDELNLEEINAFYNGSTEGAAMTRISKEKFYRGGGFSNPLYVRVTRGGRWAYYTRGSQ